MVFFCNVTVTTEIYTYGHTLSLHDALPIFATDLMSRNKKQLFRDLAERFAPIAGCNAETIVEVLAERERLGSTGFGGGVAIPHGKLEALYSEIGRAHV